MRKELIAISLATIAIIGASAENTAISPYTSYGYGNLSDNATASQRQMGSVGYAMNSGRQINVMNPASYASMDSLTFLFDMGADFTTLWSSEKGIGTEKQFGGGLDYITMQVPIIKGMGASAGLLPYSSVGYAFGNEITNGSAYRNGSGSFNQLYFGIGGQPVKGLSIGANIAYLFGSIEHNLVSDDNDTPSGVYRREMTVSDYRLDFGVQYGYNVTPLDRVTLGLTYSPRKTLHGRIYGMVFMETSTTQTVPDTINAGDTHLSGRYSLPETWGAGINWRHGDKLMAEIDFTYQPWKNAKTGTLKDFPTSEFDNRWRVGAGVQYTPAQRGSYLSRVHYRLGAGYNHDYLMVLGNNVRDYSVTMGFGFPVPGFKSIVNLGLEYRHRQAHPNPLIKENYLNVTLGINFNEMWFRKNKIY